MLIGELLITKLSNFVFKDNSAGTSGAAIYFNNYPKIDDSNNN